MAEFARWQWEHGGTFRNYAEPQQAELEAAYQRRDPGMDLSIPPFGVFQINFGDMTQVGTQGRGAGFCRSIRRRLRRIDAGYFLLGEEGQIQDSDSALDQITEEPPLAALAELLQRIVAEPEDFSLRSVRLTAASEGEAPKLCRSARELLCQYGFEEVQEGRDKFLVFMQEDVACLAPVLAEVKARLQRFRNQQGPAGPREGNHQASQQEAEAQSPLKRKLAEGDDSTAEVPALKRLRVVLPTGQEQEVQMSDWTLDELLNAAKQASGLRLPLVRAGSQPLKMLALGAEPGTTLHHLARTRQGEEVRIENFELDFIKRLQEGLLLLQDLAAVAPLLDWEKPELMNLAMGRIKALLEGSCQAWCAAAGCEPDEERRFGWVLLRRLFSSKPLQARLDVCQRLLPTEGRGRAVLQVSRERLVASALQGLHKLGPSALRSHFGVSFVGEAAPDQAGPRRELFAGFGAQFVAALPGLWRRLPRGSVAPTPGPLAEQCAAEARGGLDLGAAACYTACGRLFGLAMKHGEVVGEALASSFLRQVARKEAVGLEELQQEFAEEEGEDVRGQQAWLRRSLTDAGLKGQTFSRALTGDLAEEELVPGGKELQVTEENKEEWLRLHLEHKLHDSRQMAADAFRAGLLDTLGGEAQRTCPLLVLLSPREITQLWAGSAIGEAGVARWREVAVVSDAVQQQAVWLWELLEQGSEEFRQQVLRFSTGAGRLGPGGLARFEVQPADGGDEALPRAMTCANMLMLPRYGSKAALDSQLRKASELCGGFQLA